MNNLSQLFFGRKLTRAKLESFLTEFRTELPTLDVGAGSRPYHGLFPNSISFDIDVSRKPDIVGDIHRMEMFQNDEFNCILCTEVLEHCIEPQKAVEEMMRVLKPGGRLILSTRFLFPLHDTPHDYFRFTKYGLQYLFRKYFIEKIQEEALTMETVGILFQRIAFQSKMRSELWNLLFFLMAELCGKIEWLLQKQFGNLSHIGENENIISSGYYMVVRK